MQPFKRTSSVRGVVPQDHVSQGHPEFSSAQFLEQLVYQQGYPLSLPLVYLFRGHNAAINMRFVPSNEQSYIFIFQLILNGAVTVALALYWGALIVGASATDTTRWCIFYEVILLTVASVFQRLPVATKWAYLPPNDYGRLMRSRVPLMELQRDQLLVGWAQLVDAGAVSGGSVGECIVLDSELLLAQRSIGADAEGIFWRIPRAKVAEFEEVVGMGKRGAPAVQSERVRAAAGALAASSSDAKAVPAESAARALAGAAAPSALLAACLAAQKEAPNDDEWDAVEGGAGCAAAEAPAEPPPPPPAGDDPDAVQISAFALARLLIVKADLGASGTRSAVAWIITVACTLGCVLPLFVRIGFGLPGMGTTSLQTALFSLSIFGNFWFPFIFSHYLRIGLVDAKRRADALRVLGDLCKYGKARSQSKFSAAAPPLAAPLLGGRGAPPRAAAALSAAAPAALSPGAQAPSEALFLNPLSKMIQARDERIEGELEAGGASAGEGGGDAAAATAAGEFSPVQSRRRAGSLRFFSMRRPSSAPPPPSSQTMSFAAAASVAAALPKRARRATQTHAVTVAPMASLWNDSPILPLDSVNNLVALLITRRMLTAFGLRYLLRLQAYAGQALLLTVILIACIFILTLVALPPELNVANATIAVVALFYLVLYASLIVVIMLYGAGSNAAAEEHAHLLTARDWESRQATVHARSRGEEAVAVRWEGVSLVMASVAALILAEFSLQPLRIVGIPASYTLVRTIVISAASGATAGVNLLRGLLRF